MYSVGTQGDSWASGLAAAMGRYMGYPNPILHPIRSLFHRRWARQHPPGHFGIPHPMGGSDRAGCRSLHGHVLPSLHAPMACGSRSLGRGHPGARQPARPRRYRPPERSGSVPRDRGDAPLRARGGAKHHESTYPAADAQSSGAGHVDPDVVAAGGDEYDGKQHFLQASSQHGEN